MKLPVHDECICALCAEKVILRLKAENAFLKSQVNRLIESLCAIENAQTHDEVMRAIAEKGRAL